MPQILQRPHRKGSRASKGVQAAHALGGQTIGHAKVPRQDVVHTPYYKVYTLHGGVHNAQLLRYLGEGRLEKLLVEGADHILFLTQAIERPTHLTHIVLKILQHLAVLHKHSPLQQLYHALHGTRHRVVLRKVVACKKGIEHRVRNKVLSQKGHRIVEHNVGVQALAQLPHKVVQLVAIAALVVQLAYAHLEVGGQVAHLLAPPRPVEAVAYALHHAGIELVGELQGQMGNYGVVWSGSGTRSRTWKWVWFWLHHAHVHIGVVRELGSQSLVVATQGVQHIPHKLIALVVVQLTLRLGIHGNHHGHNDIAVAFALEPTHHTPHTLNECYGRTLGGQKGYGIQRGHIHTLAQAVYVAHNMCLALNGFAKYAQLLVALHSAHGTRHIARHGARHVAQISLVLLRQTSVLLAHLLCIALGNELKGTRRLVYHILATLGLARAHHVVAKGNAGLHRAPLFLSLVGKEVLAPIQHLLRQGREGAHHHAAHLGGHVVQRTAIGCSRPHGVALHLQRLQQLLRHRVGVHRKNQHLIVR